MWVRQAETSQGEEGMLLQLWDVIFLSNSIAKRIATTQADESVETSPRAGYSIEVPV